MLDRDKHQIEINPATVASIFKRKGVETQSTRVYSEAVTGISHNGIPLSDGEFVLLTSDALGGAHTFITQLRVVSVTNEYVRQAYFSDITDIEIDFRANAGVGATNKEEFSIFRLVSDDGLDRLISVEKGIPYWGVVSVLKWIVGRYGRDRS